VEEERPIFEVTLERRGARTVVVKARGELDLMGAPDLARTLEEVKADDADVILDLGALDFIDSAGVHLVLDTYLASRRDGWDLAICGGGPEVLRAFELTGLLDRLPFVDRG
jgi:anti-sigma B factor antagonist